MSYDTSGESAGEYWWQVKTGGQEESQLRDAIVDKNYTSGSFPAPESYLVRTDPAKRAEFAKTTGLYAEGNYIGNPSLYAMDQMYSTGSFPAGEDLAVKNKLRYEPWNPRKFSGYRS